jgi:hypothetical protein
MDLTFWGMTTFGTVILAFGALFALDYMNILPFGMPGTKKQKGWIGVILILGGLMTGSGPLAGVVGEFTASAPGIGDEEPVEAQQLVEVNIGDSDTNDTHITKESDLDQFWRTDFYYDSTAGFENFDGDDSKLDEVVMDLDLIWSKTGTSENDIATFGIKIGSVPTVENSADGSFSYKNVFEYQSAEEEYNIEIQPAGGSAQDMDALVSVTPGGSKTVTITANMDVNSDWGDQVEQNETVTLPIHIDTNGSLQDGYEETYELRLLKDREV